MASTREESLDHWVFEFLDRSIVAGLIVELTTLQCAIECAVPAGGAA